MNTTETIVMVCLAVLVVIGLITVLVTGLSLVRLVLGKLRCAEDLDRPEPTHSSRSTALTHASLALPPGASSESIQAHADEIAEYWRDKQPNIERNARHEAAHAVVAHNYGGIVTSARITAGGGYIIWNTPVPYPSQADTRWMKLAISLAGPICDTLQNDSDAGWDDDLQTAMLHAVALLTTDARPTGYSGPFTLEWLIITAREDVQRILAHHQNNLEALTRALLEHKRLTGREIHTILAAAPPSMDGPSWPEEPVVPHALVTGAGGGGKTVTMAPSPIPTNLRTDNA